MLARLYDVSKKTGKIGKNMQVHLKNNAKLIEQMINVPVDKPQNQKLKQFIKSQDEILTNLQKHKPAREFESALKIAEQSIIYQEN